MEDVLFSFQQRSFSVQSYWASHRQLLLRSGRTHRPAGVSNPFPTRVDIMFRGVWTLSLGDMKFQEGLSISRLHAVEEELTRRALPLGGVQRGTHLFALDGAEGRSLVLASAVYVAEDEGDYSDPTPFYRGEQFRADRQWPD